MYVYKCKWEIWTMLSAVCSCNMYHIYIYVTCLKQVYTHVTVFNMHFRFINNYSLHENNQTLDRIRYFTILIKIQEYMF